MRIGIMGASFDPPHKAHTAIAGAAQDALDLDKLIFVPAFAAPLKPAGHSASFDDRLAMLRLSLSEFSRPFEISTIEKTRGGTSYSIDTAKEIALANPDSELFWIIGADQLAQLHEWREIESLSRLLTFAVFPRPAFALTIPQELPNGVRIVEIPFNEMDVSSSGIRGGLKNRQMHLDLIDAKVLNYIKENKLY